MLRNLFSILIILGLMTSVLMSPAFAQKRMPNLKSLWSPMDIKGEVVDTWCYASRSVGDGRGADHAACARACAHGGITLGILDDNGKMYIAAKSRGYTGCQFLLEPFVAKRVRVKGMLADRGGCPLLKITSVEELGPGDKPLHAAGAPNANSGGAKYDPSSRSKQTDKGGWVTPGTAKKSSLDRHTNQ